MRCFICGEKAPPFTVCCDLLTAELDVDRDLDGETIERGID